MQGEPARVGVLTIQSVAEQRTAEPGHVNPQLVRSTGERLESHERKPLRRRTRRSPGNEPPAGRRPPAMDRIDPLPRRPVAIGGERQVHLPVIRRRRPTHHRDVALADEAVFKGPAERGPGLSRAGQHEQTRRVPVETVHRLDGADRGCEPRGHAGR